LLSQKPRPFLRQVIWALAFVIKEISMNLLKSLKRNRNFWLIFLVVIATEMVLVSLVFIDLGTGSFLKFNREVGIAIFTGVPLFLITIIQLKVSSTIQRSNYVRELASKIHSQPELSEAFFYLVYTYDNELFKSFKEKGEEARLKLQGERTIGRRLYDPDTFQGSEEERRLDNLLSYFDIIGFHFYRGLIPIDDIAGVLGFHLAALSTREVIKSYREGNPDHWEKSSFTKDFNSVAPHQYLTEMLAAFAEYCKQHEKLIKSINAKRL